MRPDFALWTRQKLACAARIRGRRSRLSIPGSSKLEALSVTRIVNLLALPGGGLPAPTKRGRSGGAASSSRPVRGGAGASLDGRDRPPPVLTRPAGRFAPGGPLLRRRKIRRSGASPLASRRACVPISYGDWSPSWQPTFASCQAARRRSRRRCFAAASAEICTRVRRTRL
jgi:hypothetical protein